MNDCKCGKPVRLGGHRITFNRKPGVMHYINHTDETPACGSGWQSAMMKPYPKRQEDKPHVQMMARWNAENQPAGMEEGK